MVAAVVCDVVENWRLQPEPAVLSISVVNSADGRVSGCCCCVRCRRSGPTSVCHRGRDDTPWTPPLDLWTPGCVAVIETSFSCLYSLFRSVDDPPICSGAEGKVVLFRLTCLCGRSFLRVEEGLFKHTTTIMCWVCKICVFFWDPASRVYARTVMANYR